MKRLTRYFFKGLLVLIPVIVTIYVIYAIFIRIDSLFRFRIPGLGFLMTIGIIITTGFVASNFITSKLVGLIDKLFRKLPLIKMIYTSLRDLVSAFVGDKKSFNKPVLVTLIPSSNIQVMGFVTRDSLDHFGINNNVAVYLPQSYNFAGNLIIVPKEQVTPVTADSGEIMAFIVSGGVTTSQHT